MTGQKLFCLKNSSDSPRQGNLRRDSQPSETLSLLFDFFIIIHLQHPGRRRPSIYGITSSPVKNKKIDASPSAAENFMKTEKKIPLEVDSVTNSAVRYEKTTHSTSGVKTEEDNKTGNAVYSLPLSVWSQQLRGKCLICCGFFVSSRFVKCRRILFPRELYLKVADIKPCMHGVVKRAREKLKMLTAWYTSSLEMLCPVIPSLDKESYCMVAHPLIR